jgi:adenosylmethionine-8-amino-7-oxononanoate aminotransferase
LGKYLQASLNIAFSNHPHVAEVRGRGLLAAIEIVRDRDDLTPYPIDDAVTNKVVGRGMERGVFYYGGGTGDVRDVVCMGPPFIISESEIDQMVETLLAAVDDVLG